MELDYSEINYMSDPDLNLLKADFHQFLLSLIGPTVIDVTGEDPSRCRVIVTLMQGNEASGLSAIHRWLTTDFQDSRPLTNIRFIIVSVEAASISPLFSNRQLPEGLDVNRCFNSGLKHGYYQRANLIESVIKSVNPECVIDIHNTSGNSPAFTIAKKIDATSLNLASLFSDTLILSGLSLGSLTEQDYNCATIAIETGSHLDPHSHDVAYFGIANLANADCLLSLNNKQSVKVLNKPNRLLLSEHTQLYFDNEDTGHDGITLKSNIEQFNFGSATPGQLIGWSDFEGLSNLTLLNELNENVIDEFIETRDNQLVLTKNVRIFKASTSSDLAKNDCLFYLLSTSS